MNNLSNSLLSRHRDIQQPAVYYYAVARGKQIGVFTDSVSFQNAVQTYSFPLYKKFKSKFKAEAWVAANKTRKHEISNKDINNKKSYNKQSLISPPLRKSINRKSQLLGKKRKTFLKASDLIGKRDIKRKYNKLISNASEVNSSHHNIIKKTEKKNINTRIPYNYNSNGNNNNTNNQLLNNSLLPKRMRHNNFLLSSSNNTAADKNADKRNRSTELLDRYRMRKKRFKSPATFIKAPRSNDFLNEATSMNYVPHSPSSPNFKGVQKHDSQNMIVKYVTIEEFFIKIVNQIDKNMFTFWDDIVDRIKFTISSGEDNLQQTDALQLKTWNTFGVKRYYKSLVSCGKIPSSTKNNSADANTMFVSNIPPVVVKKEKTDNVLAVTNLNLSFQDDSAQLVKKVNEGCIKKKDKNLVNDVAAPTELSSTSVQDSDLSQLTIKKNESTNIKKKKRKSGKTTLKDIAIGIENAQIKSDPPLDETQKRGLEIVLKGNNVFITGVAGTGKSLLLRRIKYELQRKRKNIAVVAPTGIAAINIGGTTINSFCGIGIPKKASDFRKMLHGKRRKELEKSDVWIIDEVSMLSGEMLDCVDTYMQQIRKNGKPFGGVQLILCGDFLQLPPVPQQIPESIDDLKAAKKADVFFLNRGFAFQAKCWPRLQVKVIKLHTVHRQGGDGEMVKALQYIREGKVNDIVRKFIADCSIKKAPSKFKQIITPPPKRKKRKRKKKEEEVDIIVSNNSNEKSSVEIQDIGDGDVTDSDIEEKMPIEEEHEIIATKLFCKNIDVDKINQHELDIVVAKRYGTMNIQACDKMFNHNVISEKSQIELNREELSQELTEYQERILKKFFSFCRAKEKVQLKLGAQVLLMHNISSQLSNGSRGVVVGAKLRTDVINFMKKIQKRVDKNKLDNIENPYMGISFKSEKDLEMDSLIGGKRYGVENYLNHTLKDCKGFKVAEEDPTAWKRYEKKWFYPVVQFDNGLKRVILPVVFSSKIQGVGMSSRTQIPLILGWAITIHRSQGMSIGNLQVDLKDVFAEGQTYVALSRATSKNSLFIKGFNDRCVKTNPMCLAYENGSKNIINWLDESALKWDKIRENMLNDLIQQQNRILPKCRCNLPAYRGTVRKPGVNQGRKFFSCSKGYKSFDKCNFFQWDS